MKSSHSRRSGFTLLEILVVLGIAAFVASLALGGFSSFQGSQRRSTCQSNLVQIYRACRLYANDNDYYPPLQRGGLAMLWGNYDDAKGVVRPPVDSSISYLKSSSALHCPADVELNNPLLANSLTPIKDTGAGGLIVDPAYISYQKTDSLDTNTNDVSKMTYNDVRKKIGPGDAITTDFARQLRHRLAIPANPPFPAREVEANIPTPSSTVVTWCQFHRGLSSKPDNVLFYDGSVRRMEITQPAGCLPGRPAATGALRLSECSTTNNNEGAALAQP